MGGRATSRNRWGAGLAWMLTVGCAASADRPTTWSLLRLEAEAGPLPTVESIRRTLLHSDAHSSQYLVEVHGPIPLHLHARHVETVVVLRGEGILTLAARAGSLDLRDRTMATGDAAVIPADVPHAFRPTSDDGVLALSIQMPGSNDRDWTPIEPSRTPSAEAR